MDRLAAQCLVLVAFHQFFGDQRLALRYRLLRVAPAEPLLKRRFTLVLLLEFRFRQITALHLDQLRKRHSPDDPNPVQLVRVLLHLGVPVELLHHRPLVISPGRGIGRRRQSG